MRQYFQLYQYQSISTDKFLSMFKETFPTVSEKVEWDRWLYSPGYSPELVPLDRTLVDQAVALSDQWIGIFKVVEPLEEDEAIAYCRSTLGTKIEEFNEWDSKQKHGFLTDLRGRIIAKDTSGEEIIWNEKNAGYMDTIHDFNNYSHYKNSEIRFMWCRLALLGCYEKVLENAKDFVGIQGRMKYIRPIYEDMHLLYPKGDYSVNLFLENESSYHSIAVKMIRKDLGLGESRNAAAT